MSRSRGQRAGLDRRTVLHEALALLEAEGLAAVSMRRLAERLGVTPNAIYNHVPDRMSIVDGLLDLVLRDVEVPACGPWRERLEQLMLNTWAALVAHPDLVPHYLSRQALGPEALRLGAATLALLSEGGIDDQSATQAMRALMIYAIGSAAIELPNPARRDSAEDAPLRATPENTAGPNGRAASRDRAGTTFRAGLRWFINGLVVDAPRT